MAHNRTRKTMRHFQCRDDLWGLFEKMAVELECSIDYLINEAMRQYARSRKYAASQMGRESSIPPETTAPRAMGGMPPRPTAPSVGSGVRQIAPPPAGPPRPSAPPPPAPSPGGAPVARPGGFPSTSPFTAPRAQQQQTMPSAPRPPVDTNPAAQVGRGQPSQPPSPMAGTSPSAQPVGGIPTLYLIFNGQKIPITKEQFIIGRGLKTSDLAIKDGNISRKHAAIIYHNGAYYIKDLGSVNGIEFKGKRIDSKRIDEGDVFHICNYELKFTYK